MKEKIGNIHSVESFGAVDGISYTFAITPATLGNTDEAKRTNLVSMLDRIFCTKCTSDKCKCI